MKRVLAVGGSDSGGGAGLQADVKTLQALGVHGCTVVTAVTAQSSTAVHAVFPVPGEVVTAQLRAVLDDLGVDVVKTGMLATAAVVEALLAALTGLPLVVDPVGASSTGQSLLTSEGLSLLRSELLPLATVVTPNLAEVYALTGFEVRTAVDLEEAGKRVLDLGPQWVLVKGGHLDGPPTDLLCGPVVELLHGARLDSRHTHGTGCTLASALAGYLALGDDVPTAATKAKAFTASAIAKGYPLGKGPGPVRQA